MQLSLFSMEDLLEGEELAIQKAKVYTAKSIFRSSGLRGFIKKYLELNDKEMAFKKFDEAFRTYGFGIPNSYSFCGVRGIGEIRYPYDGEMKYVTVEPKELFNILLENME